MIDVNMPTPEPRWVEFANLKDFNAAVSAIETWDKSREKVVIRVGDAPEPDLNKPFTEYETETLRIYATADAVQVLDAAGIQYQ